MSIQFQRSAAFTGILMPINAILDPVIYYFRSAEFRAFYQRVKRSWEGNREVYFKLSRPSRRSVWVNKVTRKVKPTETR